MSAAMKFTSVEGAAPVWTLLVLISASVNKVSFATDRIVLVRTDVTESSVALTSLYERNKGSR